MWTRSHKDYVVLSELCGISCYEEGVGISEDVGSTDESGFGTESELPGEGTSGSSSSSIISAISTYRIS